MRALCLAIMLLIVLTGCGGPGGFVHFVLPDGFRGCFWIIEKPNSPALKDIGGGWREVQVPESRIIYTRELRSLEGSRAESAMLGTKRTAAGLVVGETRVAATTVGVWIGPSGQLDTGEKYRSYFVGTEAEFIACTPEQFDPPSDR